ncbi:potassium channel family protein [Mesorhizobium sp.]|uniref:potassium channel family protein n=1 Tax=Mesorhizobium sp. TaxID=1871066 RepID=UPI0025DC1E31|nr:potassium channel family protein [Mesorhizobium sp.]
MKVPQLLIAFAISVGLALVTVLMHYEVLNIAATMRRRFSLPMRVDLLLLVVAAIIAHVVGICLFALAYAWMHHHPDLGGLAGLFSGSAADFFYFSVTCYTTIGFGEVYATGPMRIVAALEGLNGLVLIAWSASFAYASTSDLWKRKQD